jgi:hypothetical protein
MAISRMQQPRQMYGLGSFVKSIGKGVKSAVKGITGTIKDNPLLAAAAFNFAPMLIPGGASTFIGGSKAMFPGVTSLFAKKAGEKTLGDTLKVFAGGSLLGGLLSKAEEEGDPEGITRDVGALRLKLADAYRNQRTFADAEDEEAAIAKQVDLDTAEYNQDMNRTRYALGSPEQNAMKASGIMNIPLNQNPAGVKELDLRDSGGFIPPVGVKEKADDIPAMLSNNEFVFTADAVRGMGGGDVNRGAQRLYDQMKMLEKGGRV